MDFGISAQSVLGRNIATDEACASEPELIAVIGRLDASLAHSRDIESRIGAVLSRLHGEGGSGAMAKDPPRPVRSGIIGKLNDLLDDLGTTLDRIHSDTARLSRIA